MWHQEFVLYSRQLEGQVGFLEQGPISLFLAEENVEPWNFEGKEQPLNGYSTQASTHDENRLYFLCNFLPLDFYGSKRMRIFGCLGASPLGFLASGPGMLEMLDGAGVLAFPEDILWSSDVVPGVCLLGSPLVWWVTL